MREDLERGKAMQMATAETCNAEFLLSQGRFREADEHFHRAQLLYTMLERPEVSTTLGGVQRGALIAGEFTKAYSV